MWDRVGAHWLVSRGQIYDFFLVSGTLAFRQDHINVGQRLVGGRGCRGTYAEGEARQTVCRSGRPFEGDPWR